MAHLEDRWETVDGRRHKRWRVRWGGDWSGSQVDQMHFEIAADIATVKRTTERLGLTVHGRKRRGRLH